MAWLSQWSVACAAAALCSVLLVACADKKDGVAKSAYAYVNHPKLKDVILVRRGLNNSKLSVRIKGAAWNG